MLVRKGSVFEKCHAVVNPQPFYKVGPLGTPEKKMRGNGSNKCSPRHMGPTLPTEMCVPGLQL